MTMRAKYWGATPKAGTSGQEVLVRANEYGELFLDSSTSVLVSTKEDNDFLAGDGISSGDLAVVRTNVANGTYYYYVDMETYKQCAFQFILSGSTITITIEGTIQNDGTTYDACTYADVTSSVYGVATLTASDIINDNEEFLGNCKYVRVKVVCTGGGTDDYTIYHARS